MAIDFNVWFHKILQKKVKPWSLFLRITTEEDFFRMTELHRVKRTKNTQLRPQCQCVIRIGYLTNLTDLHHLVLHPPPSQYQLVQPE